jgi:hypothetical protein
MNITVKDNFFKDPDKIRNTALSLYDWVTRDHVNDPAGWRGLRSSALRDYKIDFLDDISEQIFKYTSIVRELDEWRYPWWEGTDNGRRANKPLKEPMITTYFHQAPAYIANSLPNFLQTRFHTDDLPCAGIIYLTPDPPPKSGTSIIDAEAVEFRHIENKYNRFVAYDGYIMHGVSGLFGDSLETNRLTLTFFIHEKEDEHLFEVVEEDTDWRVL